MDYGLEICAIGKINQIAKDEADLTLPKSWRPTCAGSNLAKIPERILFNTIYDDLIERKWLYYRPHGFRKAKI